MNEREGSDSVIAYENLFGLIPAEDLPVSKDDYKILQASLRDWNTDFYNIYKSLVEEYGVEVVSRTKLHHILSGSSLAISDWQKLSNDTPGDEMGNFVSSIIKKYGPNTDHVSDKTA